MTTPAKLDSATRYQARGQKLKRILVMVPEALHDRLVTDASRERRSNSAQCAIAIERYYESIDSNA